MKLFGKIVWTVARVIGLIEIILGFGDGPRVITPSSTPAWQTTPPPTYSLTATPTPPPTPTASQTPEPAYTSTPTATQTSAPTPARTPEPPPTEPADSTPGLISAEPPYLD
jgi:hypothetical protein